MKQKPLRVLLSAYACEPGKGSEPGVGWNAALQVARFHDTWVLTRSNNRSTIEAFLNQFPVQNLRFLYFDLPRWMRLLKRSHVGLLLYYYLWQLCSYFFVKRNHEVIGFDLVHHVTFVKYSMPSFLVLLGIPFVWGPVGGGESAPSSLWRGLSWRGKAYEVFRCVGRWVAEHDPFVRLTARRCNLALATTEETCLRLIRLGARRVSMVSEAGVSETDMITEARYETDDDTQFRFISLSRLLDLKGLHLSIQAFYLADLPNSEYWIVGDGPQRDRLEALARQIGVAERVRFFGWLPRMEALTRLCQCDVLVHPSFHDSGGWVCLEAMSVQKPVICLDLGGPRTQVTDETGIKIPARTVSQVQAALAQAMVELATNESLRNAMGVAGKERVSNLYLWEEKGKVIDGLYRSVIC